MTGKKDASGKRASILAFAKPQTKTEAKVDEESGSKDTKENSISGLLGFGNGATPVMKADDQNTERIE